MSDGIFRFSDFIEKSACFDWTWFQGKDVLISGCGNKIIPPWVFIGLTARLTMVAKSIHYGNEEEALEIINSTSESTDKITIERKS